MYKHEQKPTVGGHSAISQPLVDWLAQQFDEQTREQHGPWATAWDGRSLQAAAVSAANASRRPV